MRFPLLHLRIFYVEIFVLWSVCEAKNKKIWSCACMLSACVKKLCRFVDFQTSDLYAVVTAYHASLFSDATLARLSFPMFLHQHRNILHCVKCPRSWRPKFASSASTNGSTLFSTRSSWCRLDCSHACLHCHDTSCAPHHWSRAYVTHMHPHEQKRTLLILIS